MTDKKRLTAFLFTWLGISLPFVLLHLAARPDDAPISPLQHLVAALANFFGPWGSAIVRMVDFPNAGWRAFSWGLAVILTLSGAILVGLRLWLQHRTWQWVLTGFWVLFSLVWFGVGFFQIAEGLL